MVNEENFKKWLIDKKGYSIIKASEISAEAILPFPMDEEIKNLVLQYDIEQKTKNSEIITFKIPKPVKKELTNIAKENNMKLSEVIRSALYDFIDSYQNFLRLERRMEKNEKRNREEINRQINIQKNSSKH